MLQENLPIEKTKAQNQYSKLDRFLLYLLAGELGYFVLLILGGILIIVITAITGNRSDMWRGFPGNATWLILVYVLALPFNMLGGLASLILNIRTHHAGYPGTGHLLNWIFLMTTGWLFILAVVFLIPSMPRSGY